MGRLFLDSTVLIDALRGRPAADRLAGLRRVGTGRGSVPSRSRRSGEDSAHARNPWSGACATASGRALGISEGVRAGTWRRDFARRGITLAQADCLIAAAALSIGASLATANVDDFPMAEVATDHWPAGR
ncbi:MAG: hypothetical protein WKF43_11130 [Acidimicrobiales bacterium]